MTVSLKEMSVPSVVIVGVSVYSEENAPEPERLPRAFTQSFQYLFSGAGACFLLDAVENDRDHRVHPLERPGHTSQEGSGKLEKSWLDSRGWRMMAKTRFSENERVGALQG